MIESGKLLQNRYRIGKQIGQGGMGSVYVATDERFGSTVAIKETLCMDDNFRKAIEREARLLNSLKHPTLPRVSDHFEESNSQFLVMEYIPGDDVAVMLEGDKADFTVDNVLKWADQLLDGLDYLHNQEIPVIHRDIKPQNLKINPRGEMILLDFGLAKGNPSDVSHQTAAKSIFGYSRNYASLEQIQGTGTDPRSDLYSLSATLFHLLTKKPPEDALTRAMSVLSRKPDPLVPASSIDPAIPRGVSGVLHKALDLNADHRPSTAAEMRRMLRENDQYGYLADPATVEAHFTDTRIYAQPTVLMPDTTNLDRNKGKGINTEAISLPDSTETQVRQMSMLSGKSGKGNGGRSMGMLAGALLMLFIGATIALGIYLLKPSMFGAVPPPTETPDVDSGALASNANTNIEATTEAAGRESESGTANGQAAGSSSDSAPTTVTVEHPVVKKEKLVTSKPKPEENNDNVTEFNVDDPDIPAGGVVIDQTDENGKRTTMRVNPIDRSGKEKIRRLDELNNFPFFGDLNRMTPEQRRKFLRAMKKAEDARERSNLPPKAPPTPKN